MADTKPTWPVKLQTTAAVLACVAAALFVLALARRSITSVDLGYHLAYGQVFLETGRVVDDDTFIHPPVPPDDAGDILPPGARYDAEGRYYFPNANWGSQVILAWLWNRGGWTAMSLALPALVVLIAAGQAAILRRLGVPLVWLAPVWLALGAVGHERFLLRPELFAFACLTWQVWLLCGRVTWPRVVAFVGIQLAAVNLHSYWLLGAGVGLAFAGDAALRAAWARWVRPGGELAAELRGRLIRLAICTVAMIPAAMAHPAGTDNAAYPFRTLAFLREHGIAGRTRDEASEQWHRGTLHPWQTIGEFHTPFTPTGWERRSTKGLAVLLTTAAVGGMALAFQRRWALVAILAAMSLAALSMRRNMIIPAIFAGPLIAAAAGALPARWWKNRTWPRWTAPALHILLIALAAWWTVDVVTNRLYLRTERAIHFGSGPSRLALPLAVCEWLDANLPTGRPVMVDQNLSSSVLFYAEKVTAVPSLTNTWATPPSRMIKLFELGTGLLTLDTLDGWGLDVAVLQGWRPINDALIRRLLVSDDWALVHLDTWFVTFLRRTEAHAATIAAQEITSESFDPIAFIAACRRAGPTPAMALKAGAGTLQVMEWHAHAATVWEACLAEPYANNHFHRAWLNYGVCLAVRGGNRLRDGDEDGFNDLLAARAAFQRALEIRSDDYEAAARNLRQVESDIATVRRVRAGRLFQP